MRLRDIEKAAELMQVPLSHAIGARRNYLWKEWEFWKRVNTDHVTWQVLCIPTLISILDELYKLKTDLYFKNKPTKKGEITEEMKDQARNFPIAELIPEAVRGKLPCFVHEEKTASMLVNVKRNRVHCFGCHIDMDPIQVVIQREGLSFPDAVRRLCG